MRGGETGLVAVWLTSAVGGAVFQEVGPPGWAEFIFNQGGMAAVAFLVLYWKRTDDQKQQKESDERETQLVKILGDAVKVMERVATMLDAEAQDRIDKVMNEVTELKKAYVAATSASTRPSEQRPA